MKKESKDKHFIKNPIYEGGLKAMRKFIKENITYPQTAITKKVEGTVLLKYTINNKGLVIKTKVIKGIGYGCDEEAKRIVQLFRFNKPKNRRGIKVLFHKSIQIHFRLPIKKTNSNNRLTQIQYHYTSKSTKNKEGSNSYNIIL